MHGPSLDLCTAAAVLCCSREVSISEFKGQWYVGVREYYEQVGKQGGFCKQGWPSCCALRAETRAAVMMHVVQAAAAFALFYLDPASSNSMPAQH